MARSLFGWIDVVLTTADCANLMVNLMIHLMEDHDSNYGKASSIKIPMLSSGGCVISRNECITVAVRLGIRAKASLIRSESMRHSSRVWYMRPSKALQTDRDGSLNITY